MTCLFLRCHLIVLIVFNLFAVGRMRCIIFIVFDSLSYCDFHTLCITFGIYFKSDIIIINGV